MTTTQRKQMLERFDVADKWLARIYDTGRSEPHRAALWNFLMQTAEQRLKNILVWTHDFDEQANVFWQTYGKN